MQVFKTYMKVTRSKLPSAILYIVVFLAISIPLTTLMSEDSTFEISSLNICVFDKDGTDESRALTEFLGKTNEIVTLEDDRNTITDALYYETVDYVLIINKGYAKKLSSGESDDFFESYHMHDSYSTVYIGQCLDEYITSIRAYIASGDSLKEAVKDTEKILATETEVNLESFAKDNSTEEYSKSISFYFRYMPYLFISVLINVLCPVLLVMNGQDIRKRTNCSALKTSSFTVQLFLGSAIIIAAVWLVFMIAGAFMNGGIYVGRAWIAVLNSLLFALISSMIAILIASFSPSLNVVNIITQVIGLGMSFLCGVFVEQSLLGEGVLAAARFLPAYWYVKANDMLANIEPYDSTQVAISLGIEAAYIAVLAALAAVVYRVMYSRGGKRK